ncbi:ArsR/SmtB family transcription factor [Rhodohalobacter mucosus]|uniref:Transcriptional regulator n=1 Tax=Rhodohalobacter mucosus TaxID=2079485 RepID=A0A316U001_9BACT|nr:metalloregulator ArsR/SmtB family transcription factor [Rhodohalobacter mucosus]PWN05886.1 transcriptional regulator [Rhodohalobacter mucosus]
MNEPDHPTISIDDPSNKRSAELARALGHPARIAILRILASRNTCFCGDITEQIPLAQSTVSQHLKALRRAGLIKGEIEGVRTCYCLNPDGVRELQFLLSELSDELIKTCC